VSSRVGHSKSILAKFHPLSRHPQTENEWLSLLEECHISASHHIPLFRMCKNHVALLVMWRLSPGVVLQQCWRPVTNDYVCPVSPPLINSFMPMHDIYYLTLDRSTFSNNSLLSDKWFVVSCLIAMPNNTTHTCCPSPEDLLSPYVPVVRTGHMSSWEMWFLLVRGPLRMTMLLASLEKSRGV
jgi:hypothetical protein